MRCSSNVSYWTKFNKYFISWSYLMDLISCNFFRMFILNIMLVTYWIFDRPDFMWLFFEGPFKYLETKKGTFFMGILPNGSFFKLVITFLKWFGCYSKLLLNTTKVLKLYFLYYLHETCWFKMNWYKKLSS